MTATMPAGTDLRDCRLYRFYGWDPRTGYTTKTLIYIGETVREPFDRLMEHVARKPWADTITSWEVDDRVFTGKDQVLAAEKAAVEVKRPLYNHEYNLGNPDRVELSDQERQRWERDVARGRPLWRAPQRQPMFRNGQAVDAPSSDRPMHSVSDRPVSVPRKWTAVQVNTLVWSGVWVSTTGIIWGVLDRSDLFGSWVQRLVFAAVCALLLTVWGLVGAPVTRAQRRKSKRRLRKSMNSRTRRSRRR